MASKYYCSNVASELEVFSQKLHKLSSKIERIPSIDQYKLQSQIDELHMITTELDDRICDLFMSCSSVDELDGSEAEHTPGVKFNVSGSRNEHFDYDFGG